MKFSVNTFVIDKAYSEELRRKVGVFKTLLPPENLFF